MASTGVRGREMRETGRRGIGRVVVAVVVLIILLAVGVAFIVNAYEGYTNGAKAAVILGASIGDCSSVSFHVQNQDTRILHGWSVAPSISPSDAHIQMSPSSIQIEALAPKGNSSQYTFNFSFTGAPTGIYQLRLDLLNGSVSLATSEPLSCTVK
jgi:hypothetical protein